MKRILSSLFQKAKLAAIKAKREKQKIMKSKYRAKQEVKRKTQEAADSDTDGEAVKPPPTKKRHVAQDEDSDEGDMSTPKSKRKSSIKSTSPEGGIPTTKSPKLRQKDSNENHGKTFPKKPAVKGKSIRKEANTKIEFGTNATSAPRAKVSSKDDSSRKLHATQTTSPTKGDGVLPKKKRPRVSAS